MHKRLFPLAGLMVGLLASACNLPGSSSGPSASPELQKALSSHEPVFLEFYGEN